VVTEAVPFDRLQEAVDKLTAQIAANHPGALGALKSLVTTVEAADYDATHDKVDLLRAELGRERAARRADRDRGQIRQEQKAEVPDARG
jgi:hypothetical protein